MEIPSIKDLKRFTTTLEHSLGSDLLCVVAPGKHTDKEDKATADIELLILTTDNSRQLAFNKFMALKNSPEFLTLAFKANILGYSQMKHYFSIGEPFAFAYISTDKQNIIYDRAHLFTEEFCSAAEETATALDKSKLAEYLGSKALEKLQAAKIHFAESLAELHQSVHAASQAYAVKAHDSFSPERLSNLCDWNRIDKFLRQKGLEEDEMQLLNLLSDSKQSISRSVEPQTGKDYYQAIVKIENIVTELLKRK